MTHYQKIEKMLLEDWTSPLHAWDAWNILTSFRSRISEIREDYLHDPDWKLEERNRSKKNRDGESVNYKEFRLVKIKKAQQIDMFH